MPFVLIQLHAWLSRRSDDQGTTVVEYAMLLGLIAVVCLVAVNLIGTPVSTGLSNGGNGFRP
jgi:Flp pilus assembly pilin Flp